MGPRPQPTAIFPGQHPARLQFMRAGHSDRRQFDRRSFVVALLEFASGSSKSARYPSIRLRKPPARFAQISQSQFPALGRIALRRATYPLPPRPMTARRFRKFGPPGVGLRPRRVIIFRVDAAQRKPAFGKIAVLQATPGESARARALFLQRIRSRSVCAETSTP